MTRFLHRALLQATVLFLMLLAISAAQAEYFFGEPIRFPAPINTGEWESTPVLSPNGLELFFTSDRSGWGTFVSNRDTLTDAFGPPTKLFDEMSHAGISSDGLSLYVNSDTSGGFGHADIFEIARPTLDSPWGAPENMGASINSTQFDRWASISPDGLELFFTRTRTFESSVADIWVARRTDPSAPFATSDILPANINQGYTSAPSLSPDGLALFFSSDGHGGYGGPDIFVSTREDTDSPWGDPMNLGPRVNTALAEWQSSLSADGQTFLFSRNNASYTEADIWHAAVIPEPSSLVLVVTSLLVLLRLRRGKKLPGNG